MKGKKKGESGNCEYLYMLHASHTLLHFYISYRYIEISKTYLEKKDPSRISSYSFSSTVFLIFVTWVF